MGSKSTIQWTDVTWNIARGCTKVDEDCKFCYMYRDSFNNTRYNPIQKLTILWAYSEQPITKTVLNEKGKEEMDSLFNQSGIFLNQEAKDDWLEFQVAKVEGDKSNYEQLYEGEIVQCYAEGKPFRLYPDEYRIMTKEKIFEIMQQEGYHTILAPGIEHIADFNNQQHYLRSRGVSKPQAKKWASLSFPTLVMYKPYFELLTTFARAHEIYPDKFYEEVEGVDFKNFGACA